jgi:hypothetical protein
MAASHQTDILAATRQWLRPTIQILLRCGVPWREFAELAKTTYVEVATKNFGKRGRPTNVSRTAVLTGLARRDVRKQRDNLKAAADPLPGYVTKGSLVLTAWHLEPGFLDRRGKPRLLPLQGDGASFEALVHRCGGSDVPISTLLKELKTAGAVRETRDGRLQALSRFYVPDQIDEQLVRLWGTVLADVASTYVHNMTRNAKTPPRFERQAVNDRVAASAVPEFRKFLDREGQAFLERLDAWLTAHEMREPHDKKKGMGGGSEEAIRLGVGVYHIQD